MTYTAEQITSALRAAYRMSRYRSAPTSIIVTPSGLKAVTETAHSDTVLITGISAPSVPLALIDRKCAAIEEAEKAAPHLRRAADLIRGPGNAPKSSNQAASFLMEAMIYDAIERSGFFAVPKEDEPPPQKRSMMMRLVGFFHDEERANVR